MPHPTVTLFQGFLRRKLSSATLGLLAVLGRVSAARFLTSFAADKTVMYSASAASNSGKMQKPSRSGFHDYALVHIKPIVPADRESLSFAVFDPSGPTANPLSHFSTAAAVPLP